MGKRAVKPKFLRYQKIKALGYDYLQYNKKLIKLITSTWDILPKLEFCKDLSSFFVHFLYDKLWIFPFFSIIYQSHSYLFKIIGQLLNC